MRLRAQSSAGQLLTLIVFAVIAVIAAVNFFGFKGHYQADANELSGVLHSVQQIARSSDGALLTIKTGGSPSAQISAGTTTVGNGNIPPVTLSSAPAVQGLGAGTTATFTLDPDGTTYLNGGACTTVTITEGTQTFTITCNPWSVSP